MKKILIVFDEPGWCFHSHALQIQKRLPEYYIDIIDHRKNVNSASDHFDICYLMDPFPLYHGHPFAYKTIMGLRNEFLYKEHPHGAEGLYNGGFPGRCVSIKDKCSMFHVVNKNQIEVFKGVVTDRPLLLAQHGIDEELFSKEKYTKKNEEVLTVGVSGRDSKNKVFGAILNACSKTGIKFVSAQYGRNKISKDKMPDFYNTIDVYVSLSLTEGLANPPMECGAMSIPVISTRCGAIEEMIIDGESGLLIDRTEDALIGALERMKDNEFRRKLGEKFNEEIVKNWIWKVRIEDFRNMFELFFELKEKKC